MPRLPDNAALRKDRSITHLEKWFFTCLVDLADERGRLHQSVRALSSATRISASQISEMLRRLVATGYLRGSLSPDARGKSIWLIFLTEKGLLPEGEQGPKRLPITLPGPATIDAGPVRITLIVEPRENNGQV